MSTRKWFSWKTLGPAGLVLIGALALMVGCAGGGVPTSAGSVVPASTGGLPTDSITVSGYGQASGAPDVAYVSLGVSISDADVGEAVTQANQTMERVTEAITETGVAREDVQTTGFSVWPEDRYDPETGAPTGERLYHVDSMLSVVVRDISQAGSVIEAALNAGANSVGGLSFGVDDPSALQQEARTQAVEDARTRAEQLAQELGVTLGNPIIITEGYGGVAVGTSDMYARMGLGGGGGAPPISEGQLSVSVQVNVTFSITQ